VAVTTHFLVAVELTVAAAAEVAEALTQAVLDLKVVTAVARRLPTVVAVAEQTPTVVLPVVAELRLG
jgi:hypothetical protein